MGLSDTEADHLLRASVDLAAGAARGTTVKVAGSVGPYGAFLADGSEYRGNYGMGRTYVNNASVTVNVSAVSSVTEH